MQQAAAARKAALLLANVSSENKNKALFAIADGIRKCAGDILSANAADIANARKNGLSEAFIERLTLNEARIEAMAGGVEAVAALDDPIGRVDDGWVRPNGLRITKRRVPLGVIGIIIVAVRPKE